MESGHRVPFEYIYLDRAGIEGLYAQTTDRLEVESLRSQEAGKAGAAHAKVGLGPALRVLLGIDAAVAADASVSRKDIEQTRSQLSTENKLDRLRDYLHQFEEDRYFDDLLQAAARSDSIGQPVFVNVEMTFDLPQFMKGAGDVEEVNRDKALLFEAPSVRGRFGRDDLYDSSDDYFKTDKRFLGSASLDKFTRVSNGVVRWTAHEALLFRASRGKAVRLGMFGTLGHLAPKLYQVKPYAIWR